MAWLGRFLPGSPIAAAEGRRGQALPIDRGRDRLQRRRRRPDGRRPSVVIGRAFRYRPARGRRPTGFRRSRPLVGRNGCRVVSPVGACPGVAVRPRLRGFGCRGLGRKNRNQIPDRSFDLVRFSLGGRIPAIRASTRRAGFSGRRRRRRAFRSDLERRATQRIWTADLPTRHGWVEMVAAVTGGTTYADMHALVPKTQGRWTPALLYRTIEGRAIVAGTQNAFPVSGVFG
jgi:hypothetical protein